MLHSSLKTTSSVFDGLRQHIQQEQNALKLPVQEVHLFCFNLTRLRPAVQFIVLSTAVFVLYLAYGYFLELIFRLERMREYGWFMTLVQFFFYMTFGIVESLLSGRRERRIPLRMYLFLALLTVATMGLSNSSVGYLNYPTQVIFKCCKLIPVLIGGILIQGKSYSRLDWLACILMTLGLIWFTLADNQVSPNFNPYGILLISLALVADAIIGNVQEKSMKKYRAQGAEMVLYSYGIGFVYILLGLCASRTLFNGLEFFVENPTATYGYTFLLSVCGYLGVSTVMSLLHRFGALVAVTVTTCRKAITIVLSFIFFSKPFTSSYVFAGLVVLIGIYLNVYGKNREKWEPRLRQLLGLIQAKRKLGIHPALDIV